MAEIVSIEDAAVAPGSDEEFYVKAYAMASDKGAPHQAAHLYALEQFRHFVEVPFMRQEERQQALFKQLADLKRAEVPFIAARQPDAPIILLNGGIFEPVQDQERAAFEKVPGYKHPDDVRVCLQIAAALLHMRLTEDFAPGSSQERPKGQLAMAGATYAAYAYSPPVHCPTIWPWDSGDWQQQDPRTDLVKGAALIVAEIVRHDMHKEEAKADACAYEGD